MDFLKEFIKQTQTGSLKTKDYSGLKAAFESELYIEGGVLRTRSVPKDAKE